MRLAFVTPRYGAELVGGAEAQVRDAALGLAGRGHEVEVLTTVATDAQSWAPAADPGVTADGAVAVRRFELAAAADPERRAALDRLVLAGGPVAAADELAWVDARFQVPGLARHLTERGGGYDAVVYSPYLFWTTLRCLPLTRARSVLVPCLHDEPAARLRTVRAALAAAADVWFLSEPEHQLAHRLAPLGRHRVVGSAVQDPPGSDPGGFRSRHGIDRPFVLYAGRREDGKGWPQALGGFATAVDRLGLDLDLVTFGAGAVHVGGPLSRRVLDLGVLPAAEVPSAFAAATAYVQPSPNESFSRTVMEAWLAGVPVVATAAGAVVAWHCERSGGGLLYGDDLELAECLQALVDDPEAAAALGAAGRRYVRETCTWPPVLDRMEAALAAFVGPRGRPAVERLQEAARERSVQQRRSLVPMAPGFPLEPWLPVPGAGVPSHTLDAAAPVPGPAWAAFKSLQPRAALGSLRARALRRSPVARRLADAARAARGAWAGGGTRSS